MVDFFHHFGFTKEISETLKYPWQMKPPPFAVPKSLQDLQQPWKKRNLTRVKLVISPITFTADKGEVFIQSHGVPTGGRGDFFSTQPLGIRMKSQTFCATRDLMRLYLCGAA